MLAANTMAVQWQVVAMVAPVALYFLVLGLLNSRRFPQMLSGRQDFLLLMAALSPLVILPIVNFLSLSPLYALLAFAGLLTVLALVGQSRGTWVIYNIPRWQAMDAVQAVLREITGEEVEPQGTSLLVPSHAAIVEVHDFSLLRNVSIRVRGGDQAFLDRFGALLSLRMARIAAETTPMAVTLLVLATAMLTAPMILMAQKAPEIVRILTDLVH